MAGVSRGRRFAGLDQHWHYGVGCSHQVYEAGFVVADPTPEPLRDHQATVLVTHVKTWARISPKVGNTTCRTG